MSTSPPSPPKYGLMKTIRGFIEPWTFLAISVSYLPVTVIDLVRKGDTASLLSWEKLQEKWFGQFWAWAGPQVRSSGAARVVPLLNGRISRGVIHEEPVKPGVMGIVLEVGAGSGMWIEMFRNDYESKPGASSGMDASATGIASRPGVHQGQQLGRGKVTKVYGIEPNPQSHEALMRRVEEAGMQDLYEPVPLGIEHVGGGHPMWDGAIEKESVDCIVSILCLCSIPDPDYNIAHMYQCLKPGGRWYLYEHVGCATAEPVTKGMVWYQRFINLVWPHAMGGCSLIRDTIGSLKKAGPWKEFDAVRPVDEPWFNVAPHVYGILTK